MTAHSHLRLLTTTHEMVKEALSTGPESELRQLYAEMDYLHRVALAVVEQADDRAARLLADLERIREALTSTAARCHYAHGGEHGEGWRTCDDPLCVATRDDLLDAHGVDGEGGGQ